MRNPPTTPIMQRPTRAPQLPQERFDAFLAACDEAVALTVLEAELNGTTRWMVRQ
jgi:hypothetical protein